MTEEQRQLARDRGRKWYQENRERRLARCREYYQENREEKSAYTKKYNATHRHLKAEASRRYRAAHPDRYRTKLRQYYLDNLESERERNRLRRRKAYAENRQQVLDYNRRWRAEHKNVIHARDLRRKALIKGARVNLAHIKEWMASVKSKRFVRCYWCDNPVSTKRIHFDHIIALAKGGQHSIENLCVSCGPCNTSKKDRHVSAWVRIGQQTLCL